MDKKMFEDDGLWDEVGSKVRRDEEIEIDSERSFMDYFLRALVLLCAGLLLFAAFAWFMLRW